MLYNKIAAADATEIALGLAGADAVGGRAVRTASRLAAEGLAETAELVGRMAARLMHQEQLLIEERSRSAALELQLASLMAQNGSMAVPDTARMIRI